MVGLITMKRVNSEEFDWSDFRRLEKALCCLLPFGFRAFFVLFFALKHLPNFVVCALFC